MLEIFVRLQSLLATREKGATAVEYGLMVALIAITIIAMVGFVGDELNSIFETVRDELQGAGGGATA